MSDTLETHSRLVAAGLPEERSREFLRLVTDAEAGRSDRRALQDHLIGADYSRAHLCVLVEVLLQIIASRAGGTA